MAEPIEVHESSTPDQLWSALRSVIVAVSAYATGRGWIGEDTVAMIIGVVGVLAPIVIGQLKTRRRALELAALAAKVPDSVATLRGRVAN